METHNKKKKIIGISLGIIGALLLLFSGTYAYWQLTKEQSSANEIVAACLDFELSDVSEAISLESVYPMSEEESESLTGYTFKVKNKCSDNIDYTIGLNSITNNSENYLANTSLRVKLDNSPSKIYETLNDIEYIEGVRFSKELASSTVAGNSENTHLLKVWIDEFAPITEQGKTFTGKVFITGSVGNTSGELTAENCFTIRNDGTLLGYDYACGTDVVIPAEINGISVKSISSGAFKTGNTIVGMLYDETGDNPSYYVVIKDKENQGRIEKGILMAFMGTDSEEDVEGINLSDLMTIYDTEADMLEAFDGHDYDLMQVNIDPNTLEFSETGNHSVKELNLTNTVYLETIAENALSSGYGIASDGECESQTEGYCGNGTLEKLTLPDSGSLQAIERDAFTGNQLKEVIIPENVTLVGDGAFKANKLESVVIPSTVTTIEYDAFKSNPIQNITILGDEYRFNDSWSSIGINYELIPKPSTSIDACFNVSGSSITYYKSWCPKDVIIPSSINGVNITSIGDNAFYNRQLTSVTFPEGLISIGSYAFANNYLQDLIFSSTITTVGDYAFENNQLFRVLNPGLITSLGSGAFRNNQISNTIVFNHSLKEIPDSVFENNQITTVYFPNDATSIGSGAFENNLIEEITIHPGIKNIGMSAFLNNRLRYVYLNAVETVGNYAFQNNLIGYVTINETTNSLGYQSFKDNPIKNINFYGNAATRFISDWTWIGFPENLKPSS